MFKHILVPTDGSELSTRAATAAVAFAKSIGARITAYCAIEEIPWAAPGYVPFDLMKPEQRRADEERWARTQLGVVEAAAKQAGVACESQFGAAHTPSEGIIQAATQRGCDLIFMASHGRHGLSGVLLGSETAKVLTHCKLPVLVFR